MKGVSLLFALLASTVLALPRSGPGYDTDRGTVGFLHYNLLSGGEITFPPEAVRQNLQGSGFFVMRLRPDGAVESVAKKMSTGYAVLDEHITRVLKAYRFKPGTRQPLLWLVGFIQPGTVIVKLNLIKEEGPPSSPKKK